MNHIGQRIKELRKKNDLTQEALADLLGITYKAVSKWECGLTVPDIALIVPMARLFHVTADELLSGKEAETDMRRAELDERCKDYWKHDQKEMYQLAVQAVKEYPGDYKYLVWLAYMEYFMAYEDEYREDPSKSYSPEMVERSIKHSNMVIERCTDSRLREEAMWNALICCRYSNQHDKALTYAKMFPEKAPITRDKAMEICLKGDKLIAQRQAIARNALYEFCMWLMEIYRYAKQKEPHVMAALDTEEAVIKTIFPDGNYLEFHWLLFCIYSKRTKLEIHAGKYDKAMEYLKTMLQHANQFEQASNTADVHTCGIFDRIPVILDDSESDLLTIKRGNGDYVKPFPEVVKGELMTEDVYAPLREREDFKALLIEV